MIELLKERGWLSKTDGPRIITPAGWERIESLHTPTRAESLKVFVAMAFHRTTVHIFEQGMLPAIGAFGLEAVRIDKIEHNHKICDRIVASIRQSRFVVADFTRHRGGVYYEAGFAHGLDIPVIWTCHEKHFRRVHFDTRQYNHIVYRSPQELAYKLKARISATIPRLPKIVDLPIIPEFEGTWD